MVVTTNTVSLVSTTDWVLFIANLNDLWRCPNNSDSELNSSKQRLHELLTLLVAIVSFLSFAFPSKFVIRKSIYCEYFPLFFSGPSYEISVLVGSFLGNHKGVYIFSFIQHH